MEKLKNTSEILLARYKRKSFLFRIVTGDEKFIYFKNFKRKNHGHGRPRGTIHIYLKTESIWQKDHVLCLVGPEARCLL